VAQMDDSSNERGSYASDERADVHQRRLSLANAEGKFTEHQHHLVDSTQETISHVRTIAINTGTCMYCDC